MIPKWVEPHIKRIERLADHEVWSLFDPMAQSGFEARRDGNKVLCLSHSVPAAQAGARPLTHTFVLWPDFDPLAAYPVREEGR